MSYKNPKTALRETLNHLAKEVLMPGQFTQFIVADDDMAPFIKAGESVEEEEVVLTARVEIKGRDPIVSGDPHEGAYIDLWATAVEEELQDKYWVTVSVYIWSETNDNLSEWCYSFKRSGGFLVERVGGVYELM